MASKKQKNKLTGMENRWLVARGGQWGVGETSEEWEKWVKGGQKVQTSSYKINKSWGCNVQRGNYS